MDILAIVSKAVFEADARREGAAALGRVLGYERYGSAHKALDALGEGGALFLVTVRPPDERLWLVGILEAPAKRADGWYAARNTTPITDISGLRGALKFASGKGIQAAAGALGMSLQTPRGLTEDDARRLRAAVGGKIASAAAPVPAPAAKAPAPAAQKKPALIAGDALDALEAAFAEDAHAALRAALDAWRARRWPELAALVDALSARVAGPAVTAEAEWIKVAAARKPADLGRLLPAVPTLPVRMLPTAADMLVAFGDDPRVAMATARWAQEPPTTSSSTYPFWSALLAQLAKAGDVRVRALVDKRLAMKPEKSQFWPKFYAGLERALAKMATPADATPADKKRLAQLAARVPKLAVAEAAAPMVSVEPTIKVAGPPLAQAQAHAAAGRAAQAAAALAEAWRQKRVPRIADALDVATRLLPAWDAPLVGAANDKAVDQAWHQACDGGAVAALPMLLEHLVDGKAGDIERRLVDVANLADDPRVAMRLAEACGVCNISPERGHFWRATYDILLKLGDVRTIPILRSTFANFEGGRATYYDHMRTATRLLKPFCDRPPAAPALTFAEEQQLTAIEKSLGAQLAKAQATHQRLVDDIAAEWRSEAPRLVYADWLNERSHPRGELIVLALKKSRSGAEDKQLEALSACRAALGLLEDFADRPDALDRGLTQALQMSSHAGAATWRKVAGYPLLSLLETLTLDYFFGDVDRDPPALAALILDGGCARLRRIEDVPEELQKPLERLLDGRWRRRGAVFTTG